MIKIIEDLNSSRAKNIETSIEEIIKRLKTVKENVELNPDKYDLETIVDILYQIYDDIGDFYIAVGDESIV